VIIAHRNLLSMNYCELLPIVMSPDSPRAKPVMSTCILAMGFVGSSWYDVFQPTHINRNRRLFEEAVAISIEHNVPVDVTAFPADDDSYDAAEAITRCLAVSRFPTHRLTCSSDGAGCLPVFDDNGELIEMDIGRPETLLTTLSTLVDRGFALEQVLPIFTSNVADQLRLRRKGRVRVGDDADLVLLDDAGKANGVMALGRWMMRDGLQLVHGTFERASSRRTETP
jgi:beta-aspartyl-dipeptidase (metallo-type)